MCVPISDASDRYRSAFGTALGEFSTIRYAPYDCVDDILRPSLFPSRTATTCQHACLDRPGTHPDRQRTAEGRRRERDPTLLVTPSDPYYIYTPPLRPTTYSLRPTTPTTLRLYIYIYILVEPASLSKKKKLDL